MKPRLAIGRLSCLVLCLSASVTVNNPFNSQGADANPPPPSINIGLATNGLPHLAFPFPAAAQYTVYGSSNPGGPFTTAVSGVLIGPTFVVTNPGPFSFFRISAMPISSNELFSATVLKRLTYGPTPADVERIQGNGPQAFIDEQLAWDGIVEDLDTTPPIVNTPIIPPPPPPLTNWIRVSATGTATSTNFFIHLSAAGTVYIDDVRLVLGAVPDVGPNLLANGDFEEPLTSGWTVAAIYSQSTVVSSPTVDGLAASGTNCLKMIGTSAGSGGGTSIQQVYSPTNYPANQQFTLSYSYLPVLNTGTNILTVRLSGSQTIKTVTLPSSGPVPPTPPPAPFAVSPVYAKLTNGAPPMAGYELPPTNTSINDLRAYHILHSLQSKRQLYELMVQFFENHFTTQASKTEQWFDDNFSNSITNAATRQNLAVDLEWREHQQFRQALLNPNCSFYDLLKISIESPAMIIYLDTVLSTRTAPNENYAREILELHTMGADNGYVQQDIVELARVWTGWHVTKKDVSVASNPFAAAVASVTNDPGVFVLNFRPSIHTTNVSKRLFTNVVIEPRFGPFRGGQLYGITINVNQFPGTNGMAEGYLVISNLANLPQTMEFLSVKLCRTFVHENFDYGIYDYNNPGSPEAQLVKDCMTAWNTPAADGRKGNIRSVLRTIFNSALFRGHAASQQKIKTPLEFALSAIRALRAFETDTNDWVSATGDSDGSGLISPLSRMGGMNLFDKAEPDGYSEFGRIWLNTSNLDERWRFVDQLLMASNYALKTADGSRNNISDPSKLIRLKLPSTSWNDPGAIADFFLGILFPGEGVANLGQDRQAAIDFLNTSESGSSSPFNFANHDGRIRGMVAMLMSFPRFQEQ
jgi:uncharacterized protein (DUF1800 family)